MSTTKNFMSLQTTMERIVDKREDQIVALLIENASLKAQVEMLERCIQHYKYHAHGQHSEAEDILNKLAGMRSQKAEEKR
jgi:hypothetical protein